MKTRNKLYYKSRLRLLCLLTALLGIFGAGQTWAANDPTTLVVGETTVVENGAVSETTSGNGWSYADGVLTLTNATITGMSSTDYGAAIYAAGDLTIELEGSSTATGAVHSSDMPFSGLYVSGTLTIRGEGSLTVNAVENTNGSKNNYGIYAITYIQNGGRITSQSGTGAASRGVYAYYGMTVNKGSLTATGGTATGGSTYDSSGIYATGTITVGSATVTAVGGSGTDSYGIYSSTGTNSLTVTGGTVTATGNSAPIYIETRLPPNSSARNHVSVTVSNSGSITARGEAGIVLKSIQVEMSGTITGTGSMTVESGSTLLANSVTVNNNPLAPTGEGSWLIYGQSDQTSPMHGNVTLPDNLTIDNGNTFTIPAGSTLTVLEGVKLTVDGTLANQGTLAIANENSLTGSGTLSGDGSFVATAVTDIVVPEGVTCADYREKVALGGPTVLGVAFLADAEGWTLSFEPGVCTPDGCTYTATATNGSKTFSQTFTALHSFDEAEGKCPCGASQAQTDAQGRYLLADAFQLRWFAALVNGTLEGTAQNAAANAVLTKDIALTGEDWTPIGNASTIYTGTFDGAGYTIDGMKIDDASSNYQGFVGYLGTGTIKNLTLGEGCSVTGGKNTGGLCGWNNEGTITACTNKGAVNGSGDLGGICGHNLGTVDNCANTGAVDNDNENTAGGICGYSKTALTGCTNSGSVTGSTYVGGIVGYTDDGAIENCQNSGSVTGNGEDVGGICGFSNQPITNCANTGAITGGSNVGGVCGLMVSSKVTLSNCYSTGTVTGTSNKGDIYGKNGRGQSGDGQGTITNCYYQSEETTSTQEGIAPKTDNDFKSGEVAYLLQGSQQTQAWGQALGTDNYPVPTTDEAMRVYAAKQYNGSANATDVYANTSGFSRPEGSNAICVIENAPSASTGTNIVVKNGEAYTCANLVLTDGADFYTPVAFTATEATYSRTLPETSTWGTIVLPFAAETIERASLYEATEIVADGSEESILAVQPVTGGALEAHTPALFQGETAGTTVTFSASGAEVAATNGSTLTKTIGESGYTLTGSLCTINPLTEGDLFIAKDKFWSVGTQNKVGMQAFRAYIDAPEAGPAQVNALRILVGDATSIRQALSDGTLPVDVYNLQGVQLRKNVERNAALEGLPAGIYIVGGKKVVKK